MFIPGIAISIVTFPGVIVHELAHQLFCRLFKVPVFKVVYFQAENPCGYVLHERTKNITQAIFISTGPFILNTIIGLLIGFTAALQLKMGTANLLDYLMLYLAISIAMHAFPSTGDAQSLWSAVVHEEKKPWYVKVIVAPIVGFIYLGAMGSFFWMDLAYGMLVAIGLPWLILGMFA